MGMCIQGSSTLPRIRCVYTETPTHGYEDPFTHTDTETQCKYIYSFINTNTPTQDTEVTTRTVKDFGGCPFFKETSSSGSPGTLRSTR